MKVKHLLALLALVVIVYVAHAFNLAFTQFPKQPQYLFSITGGSGNHKLKDPTYALTDNEGKIFVADGGNHAVKVFSRQGSFLYEFNKTTNKASLIYPYGLGLLTGQRIVVADPGAGTLYEFNTQGKYLQTWIKPEDKLRPGAVFVTQGKVYVTDLLGRQILVFDDRGKLLHKIKPQTVDLGAPQGLNVDNQANLWVADGSNYNVKLLGETGELKTVFDGGPQQALSMAKGLAVDGQGRIYVADQLANLIRVFDGKGNDLFSLGLPAEQGQFLLPLGLSIDASGKIYIADQGHHQIQVWGWQ